LLMHNRAAVLCHADSGGSSSAVTSIPAGCGPAGAESAQEADMPLDTLRQVRQSHLASERAHAWLQVPHRRVCTQPAGACGGWGLWAATALPLAGASPPAFGRPPSKTCISEPAHTSFPH
jgi:hypothetical protein